MPFTQAQAYLDSFINYEITSPVKTKIKLEKVRRFLQRLENPQGRFKSIQIAGTKGKGSTCLMLASILANAGYKVGLYTSPHFIRVNERIRIFDKTSLSTKENPFYGAISSEDFSRILLKEVQPVIEKSFSSSVERPTYFEVLTALALLYFAKEKVDIAILETGMGGRLDATNVVKSFLCGLTPISLEHTRFLGNTLEAIAAEKAAIIKDREQRVVVAPQKEPVERTIRAHVEKKGTEVVFLKEEMVRILQAGSFQQKVEITGLLKEPLIINSPLIGKGQAVNLLVAVAMALEAQKSGYTCSITNIQEGIGRAYWPGRFEVISSNPIVVLDGAHNEESCRDLMGTIQWQFPQKRIIVILSISKDKDIEAICRQVASVATEIIITRVQHPRSWDYSQYPLGDFFGEKPFVATNTANEALELAHKKASQEDVIIATGSLFLVGEIRQIWQNSLLMTQ